MKALFYSILVCFTCTVENASWSKSAITKSISGCVRIACSSLMITSRYKFLTDLLQVVNCMQA